MKIELIQRPLVLMVQFSLDMSLVSEHNPMLLMRDIITISMTISMEVSFESLSHSLIRTTGYDHYPVLTISLPLLFNCSNLIAFPVYRIHYLTSSNASQQTVQKLE